MVQTSEIRRAVYARLESLEARSNTKGRCSWHWQIYTGLLPLNAIRHANPRWVAGVFFLRDLRFLDAESVENPRVYVCIKYYIYIDQDVLHSKTVYVYSIIEGSLEAKLPTTWTDGEAGKQLAAAVSAVAVWRL